MFDPILLSKKPDSVYGRSQMRDIRTNLARKPLILPLVSVNVSRNVHDPHDIPDHNNTYNGDTDNNSHPGSSDNCDNTDNHHNRRGLLRMRR
ncbi:MAG: hypothetical protein H6Q52_453 [Deltaproteobacteria bacterium]|nr:hypothetical protein [Deltaproteobacteria bacterium]